ncbi:MAG: long-chain fatty acid--CoA ligase [Candidatus Omnitrophica bacterium]|nr:long-chain fatty acid--CoA ligase [Candidatus Omnitrophota bacterium]
MDETIPARFARQAAALGTKPLFLVKRRGTYQPITWAEAAETVQAFSAFLLSRKINAGDRVVILSENRPEWGIADLAIQSVGAWSVPIYPSLTAQDLHVIFQDCQPSLCVASTTDQANKLLEVSRRVASIHTIVVMDAGEARHPLESSWAASVAQGREQSAAYRDTLKQRQGAITPDETATLIYTSGTTGEPKGVMLSHRNFLSNVEASLQAIPVSDQDLHLSFLPLSHVFERMGGWYLMLSVGACVAYAESMDTIPQNMLEVRPTIMLGVPRFFEKLYLRMQEGLRQASPMKRRLAEWAIGVGRAVNAYRFEGKPVPIGWAIQHAIADRLVFQKFKARLGGRVRFFVSGGAPLSQEIGEFFYSVGVTILEGYGLTETSPVIAANRLPVPRFGSVGTVLPGVEVSFATDGELLTKGPHVMQGYYHKPDATAAAIEQGWFHTGDIGHIDAQGHVYITDRKKDLIKTAGGKFVAPQKLENLFVTDPAVSQAFVYGEKRPYCVALIVPNLDQLRRYAQEQEIVGRSVQELIRDPRVMAWYWQRVDAKQQGLASFEQVKKIALLDQEFSQASGELTPTLKAKRNVIAQRYEALLASLYQTGATSS